MVLPGQNNWETEAVGAVGTGLTLIVAVAGVAHELFGSVTV